MRTTAIAFILCLATVYAAWPPTPPSNRSAATALAAEQKAPPGFKLGDPAKGRKIFKQYCKKCHGKKGNGQGIMAKDLNPKPRDFTDKERMSKRSDWQIFTGIKEGGAGVGLSEQMAGWKDTLTEQEMLDVAAYIRQFAK